MKTLHLPKPHVLVMIGGPASGKTAFAEKFADTFHAPYINADAFLGDGSTDTTAALSLAYDVMRQLHKTSQTIVYEGITGTKAERTDIARLAREHGYEPLFVWVQTEPSIAAQRATKRTRSNPQPLSQEEFDKRHKRFTPPASHEKSVVISGMHTYASQAKAVLKKLTEQQQSRTSDSERPSTPAQDRPSGAPPERGARRRSVIVR